MGSFKQGPDKATQGAALQGSPEQPRSRATALQVLKFIPLMLTSYMLQVG